MRTATVFSAVLSGVDAIPIEVQVQVTSGLPSFQIVGMPDTAVVESRERVRAAFKSTGLSVPAERVTVNLAPAHVRKVGSGLDLPIAIGLMIAAGYLRGDVVSDFLTVGELSLSGKVQAPAGGISFALLAQKHNVGLLSGPLGEIMQLIDIPVAAIECLSRLITVAKQGEVQPVQRFGTKLSWIADEELDFSDVVDQEAAIRALTISAVGSHNILMMGEPGSGKTMLARRLPYIMPLLSSSELLEVAQVHSVVDPYWEPRSCRPFRAPHHSATSVGLIGGGSPVSPGEVTLAHKGILFLDEIFEFKPASLQMLRQPLESGEVRIVRAMESVRMPAHFQLVATANPCPCGYYGSLQRACTCTAQRIAQYHNRLGGPLMDRIDMYVTVPRPAAREMVSCAGKKNTGHIRDEVGRAITFRAERKGCHEESRKAESLRDYLVHNGFTDDSVHMLSSAAESLLLSGRSMTKVSTIARTIADLDARHQVDVSHLAEALSYRRVQEI